MPANEGRSGYSRLVIKIMFVHIFCLCLKFMKLNPLLGFLSFMLLLSYYDAFPISVCGCGFEVNFDGHYYSVCFKECPILVY